MLLLIKYISCLMGLSLLPHPFYVSVTELKYNSQKSSIEISCKMFSNDLEDALKKTNGKPIDLLNPKNKPEVEKLLFNYIANRLTIQVNGKTEKYGYIGYEKEEEAIWTYLEITHCQKPQNISIENKLLYDFLKEQINIVHFESGTYKESSKVTNPDSKITFLAN